jgi:hypothetical protein
MGGDDDEYYQSTNLPSNTFMLKERSCFTNEGSIGSCTSLRSCYPTFKLSQVNQEEMWVMFTRGTCSYGGENGRQVFFLENDVKSKIIKVAPLLICRCTESAARNNPLGSAILMNTLPVCPLIRTPGRQIFTRGWIGGLVAQQSMDKQSTCGAGPTKTLSFDEQRIVGGTDAQKNSWPSIVSGFANSLVNSICSILK